MAKSANDKQPYIIGLVIFVLLTFVLGGSNYFAYKWGFDAQKALEEAQKKESEANSKMLTAIRSRRKVVLEVLGIDLDNIDTDNVEEILKQDEEILQRKKKQVDDVYGTAADAPATYAKALEWLDKGIKESDSKREATTKEKEQFEKEKQDLVAEKDRELQAEKKKVQDAQAELAKMRETAAEYEKQSTEQKDELIAQKKAVEERLAQLKTLSEKIAESQRYLSDERKKQWPAGGDGADAVDIAGDMQRLDLFYKEMNDKERAVARLNQVVSQVRVADTALQSAVLAATPKDDRVDGFDGRILSVNEMDRTVLVAVGSTQGIRTGLIFYVYDPADPQPQISARKGVIEVVAVEGGSLLRARVRQDSIRRPILPGDTVATSLWAPDSQLEVVLVGVAQFGGEATADAERFKRIVEQIGGTVESSVGPTTTVVVDGGAPRTKGSEADLEAGRKPLTEAQRKRRELQLAEAKRLGIKVMTMEPFLGMMGLQLDAVGANRLPVPADRRAAPARAENLAY